MELSSERWAGNFCRSADMLCSQTLANVDHCRSIWIGMARWLGNWKKGRTKEKQCKEELETRQTTGRWRSYRNCSVEKFVNALLPKFAVNSQQSRHRKRNSPEFAASILYFYSILIMSITGLWTSWLIVITRPSYRLKAADLSSFLLLRVLFKDPALAQWLTS